jgi:hypothetical protein
MSETTGVVEPTFALFPPILTEQEPCVRSIDADEGRVFARARCIFLNRIVSSFLWLCDHAECSWTVFLGILNLARTVARYQGKALTVTIQQMKEDEKIDHSYYSSQHFHNV